MLDWSAYIQVMFYRAPPRQLLDSYGNVAMLYSVSVHHCNVIVTFIIVRFILYTFM